MYIYRCVCIYIYIYIYIWESLKTRGHRFIPPGPVWNTRVSYPPVSYPVSYLRLFCPFHTYETLVLNTWRFIPPGTYFGILRSGYIPSCWRTDTSAVTYPLHRCIPQFELTGYISVTEVWREGVKRGCETGMKHIWSMRARSRFETGMKRVWNGYETGLWKGYETQVWNSTCFMPRVFGFCLAHAGY